MSFDANIQDANHLKRPGTDNHILIEDNYNSLDSSTLGLSEIKNDIGRVLTMPNKKDDGSEEYKLLKIKIDSLEVVYTDSFESAADP